MQVNSAVKAINVRYSELAEESCCLSCGGAINHAGVESGEICADLGSGRGLDVIKMAQAVGAEGRAYGIDVSEGMIRKARKNIDKFDVMNAEIIQSALESLPFKDGELDLIISNCTINHAEDKRAVWMEIARSLKSGGRFVVSDIYSMEEVPEKYRNDPEAVAECWAGSVTRDEYLDQLAGAGFGNLDILEESAPYEKAQIQCVSWTIRAYKA
ncbi:MAG: methyltransferase type 11 [Spirochaetes bacterium]|nr:MAG: methyltransferase type 11 [Spirochaetota bacterium]RKX98974.1 MAG: methyltransferase type 11 [Spirochaetota bacterium]